MLGRPLPAEAGLRIRPRRRRRHRRTEGADPPTQHHPQGYEKGQVLSRIEQGRNVKRLTKYLEGKNRESIEAC